MSEQVQSIIEAVRSLSAEQRHELAAALSDIECTLPNNWLLPSGASTATYPPPLNHSRRGKRKKPPGTRYEKIASVDLPFTLTIEGIYPSLHQRGEAPRRYLPLNQQSKIRTQQPFIVVCSICKEWNSRIECL